MQSDFQINCETPDASAEAEGASVSANRLCPIPFNRCDDSQGECTTHCAVDDPVVIRQRQRELRGDGYRAIPDDRLRVGAADRKNRCSAERNDRRAMPPSNSTDVGHRERLAMQSIRGYLAGLCD